MPLSAWDKLRVTVSFQNDECGDVQNVFYLRAASASADSDSAIVSAIGGWLDIAYSYLNGASNLNSPFSFKTDVVEKVGGVVKIVRTLGEAPLTITSPPAGTGSALPTFVSPYVSFKTAEPRVKKGAYPLTWTESATDTNEWTSAIVAALASFASVILAGRSLSDTSLISGVISTVRDGEGDGFYPLISAVASELVGRMGRRKKYRGS